MATQQKKLIKINPTRAREDLYNLINHVSDGDFSVLIENSKTNQTVIIEQYEADQYMVSSNNDIVGELGGAFKQYSKDKNLLKNENTIGREIYLKALAKRNKLTKI